MSVFLGMMVLTRETFRSRKFRACLSRCYHGAVYILPMPRLSPMMLEGTVVKWHTKEGDAVQKYSLIADIRPNELTKVQTSDEGPPEMEIELQDDVFVAKLFATEGQKVPAGYPVALLCESREDIAEVKNLKVRSGSQLLSIICMH
jgi:pyruvate/2-oxoglutarate dehydrogenase complex dihydrolipoamide acyltransferase (E2) component